MERQSKITIRETNETRQVRIGSRMKPEIQKNIIDKWQSLIDTAARLAGVPSGLIMRLNEQTIEVFLKSNTRGNPYEEGEQADLVYGLYCETVIGTQEELLVPDATKSEVWRKENPDVDLNMISYLGVPVNWPDGEVFGTVCLLDNKENQFDKDYRELLQQVKLHLENDLELLVRNEELKGINKELQQSNDIKSRFLSLISHDIRGSVGIINEFIKTILNNYEEYGTDTIRPVLESLSQNASSAYETLENLLSWSKKDLVQLQPDFQEVDLIDVIEKTLDFFEQPIGMKEIEVSKSYESGNVTVRTDPNMFTVVIRNLISNAIKFNPRKGRLHISVRRTRKKQEVIIEDTGTGMDRETLDQLFTYRDKHREGTRGESSAGIGLMLVKEFADKLDAQITVRSTLNKGSSFTIEI